jgi:preprotein translocase subunit SecF
MTRSIYTSLTLAFVLLCILVLGPDSISGFTLTMLFGTIVGTFSSIFIASPLLYEFHKKSAISEYVKKEELSEDDKMVV